MSGIRLYDIEMFHLLWLLPVLTGLFIYAAQRRRTALETFVKAGLLKRLPISTGPAKRGWKAFILLTSFAFIVIGLARPAWNEKEITIKRSGRDVIFVLDVSKSMLAEDLVPNRLDRAKLAVQDCVERLQGDRVALVAFAGTTVVKCPLTVDYGFFRMMLDDITIESISRGGTMIGDAIRTVLDEVFDDQGKQYKDIILITDGEDHESFPVEAAHAAGEEGVRLIVIGLGDENEGRRIPVTDEKGNKTFLKYNGQEVWTKLDAHTLREMANATPGGRYLPVSTGTIDLGDVYIELIAGAEKKEIETKTIKRYEEKFQVFLTIGFFLLCIEAMISEYNRRPETS
ncbi:MAG: VWA domain-containing protein [Thermodesulfobacteriota bacterium]|nr:VWA domain-containing protein [Thermodesulfobacteriota bacterium]